MTELVTIFGGSGFVGRYIARRMAKRGWRVRVAVRNPNEAMYVRTYGAVGQVEPVFCNIRDDASVTAALNGSSAVVNCVGVLVETGRNTFDAVQAEGAERIARLSAQAGVGRMVHLSAIGASDAAESEYAKTKAAGEAGVLAHMPDAVILRPSVIFGAEDAFFNRFASMARVGSILPVIGAETLFQPVYVDDVAAAAEHAVTTGMSGVYELGGPDVCSFRELMHIMLETIRRRRLIINIPFWAGRILATLTWIGQFLSLGIVKAPVTQDQLINLAIDNVVSEDAQGLEAFDIRPTALTAILPDYLWRFRPSGQYDAIKESAKNLRT
jgi:NADH dehydrogenase